MTLLVSYDTVFIRETRVKPRPSHREITGKIRAAAVALSQSRVKIVDLESLLSDADELEYTLDELNDVLVTLLEEASPETYAGAHPPQKSYEVGIKGADLFAFRVDSTWFGRVIYLKFAIHNDTLWLVSLHKNR